MGILSYTKRVKIKQFFCRHKETEWKKDTISYPRGGLRVKYLFCKRCGKCLQTRGYYFKNKRKR